MADDGVFMAAVMVSPVVVAVVVSLGLMFDYRASRKRVKRERPIIPDFTRVER